MVAKPPAYDLNRKNTRPDIWQVASAFEKEPLLRQFLDAMPNMVMVLNEGRQVVFANQVLLDMLKKINFDDVYGSRPGEILGCIHADETEDGCGTTENCRVCGAFTAILQSQAGLENIQDYHLSKRITSESHDYRVHTSPLQYDGQQFTIFTLADISNENRRQALERIFFHDILNTAGGLKGYLELINKSPLDEQEEMLAAALSQARLLIAEIQAQKNLAAAEDDKLTLNPVPLDSSHILKEVATFYDEIASEGDKTILIDSSSGGIVFISDEAQVNRVLGNLVKNALEATPTGKNISVGCRLEGGEVEFWVQNPYVMPLIVRMQVFQRSFSTKGSDRGLGTYSVKLITERYLGGSVSFTSDPQEGTIFRVRLPRALKLD